MTNITFSTRKNELASKIEELKTIAPEAAAELNKALEALEAAEAVVEAAQAPAPAPKEQTREEYTRELVEKIASLNDTTFNRKELSQNVADMIGYNYGKVRGFSRQLQDVTSPDGKIIVTLSTTKAKQENGLLMKTITFIYEKVNNDPSTIQFITYNFKKGEYTRA